MLSCVFLNITLFLLFFVTQEGTDFNSYESIEVPKPKGPRDEPAYSPICPFVLLNKHDMEFAAYVKIDRFVCIQTKPSFGDGTLLSSALDTLYKSHHVFHLNYHPYLEHFFSYMDLCYNIKGVRVPTPSIKGLKITLDNIAASM